MATPQENDHKHIKDAQTDEKARLEPPSTEFGEQNKFLAALVPDVLEDVVDALVPDELERVLDKACEAVYTKYQNVRTDFQDGVGEVAGVLWRVANYAWERFRFHDLVFGVYHLALHHATVNAADDIKGTHVHDAALVKSLLKATNAAAAAYCPDSDELCAAAGVAKDDLLLHEPETTTTRPAYALWRDAREQRLVWAFRGTTDLNDMLTDACASCEPYAGGYAHWGMLQAAEWFADQELLNVRRHLDDHPGYSLLLVGHSLGAGTAAMLAHLIRTNKEAADIMAGVDVRAVGVATPAVLTEELAEGCNDYITSLVLQHDIVPRFSIHSVFAMKEEMDATRWGDILASTLADWAVPDVIENSETYKRLSAASAAQVRSASSAAAQMWLALVSWFVSMMHFLGLVKPNPAARSQQLGTGVRAAAAATAATARAAVGDAHVVADAVAGVSQQVAEAVKADIHAVYAPGRLFYIRRLDRYLGRARYGSGEHRCVLCESHDAVPDPEPEQLDTDAVHRPAASQPDTAGAAAAPYPGAQFELVEAAPKQRFKRIVLRETCLMDHCWELGRGGSWTAQRPMLHLN